MFLPEKVELQNEHEMTDFFNACDTRNCHTQIGSGARNFSEYRVMTEESPYLVSNLYVDCIIYHKAAICITHTKCTKCETSENEKDKELKRLSAAVLYDLDHLFNTK